MPDQLVPFLLLCVLITIAPGPDIALGLRNSLRGGASRMWWTGLGCCTGVLVHAAASVAGLSALLAASATAYTFVKLAGAAYLGWLGLSTLVRSIRRPDEASAGDAVVTTERGAAGEISTVTAYRQGLISNLLNPKVIMLFLTMLPQFVSADEPHALTSLELALAFVVVGLLWWRLASWLVGAIRTVIARRRVRLVLERVTGTVLIALGLRVAIGN